MNKTSSIFAAPRTSQSPPNRVSTNYMVARAHRIFRHRPGELTLAVVVLLIALVVYRVQPSVQVAASASAVERGRLVYISEGCIHCHSQYVDKMRPESLPLIDNRRQGPDLSQVGARRSVLWLKMHLYNPRQVSGSSIMPSYAFLFRDQRGNDLVAYLASLGTPVHISTSPTSNSGICPPRPPLTQTPPRASNSITILRHLPQYKWPHAPQVAVRIHRVSGSSDLRRNHSEYGATGDRRPARRPESTHIDHLAQIIKFGLPDFRHGRPRVSVR